MLSQSKIKKCCLVLVMALIAGYFSTVNAVDGLDGVRDVISNSGLDTLASHTVRFNLPVSSPPIEPDDFIIVDLPSFSNITEPTAAIGNYSGTPIFSALSYRAKVTGITVAPGSAISIRGITAYNPSEPDLFDVWIYVTHDSDGLNIRNQIHTIATPTDGSIVVSAAIDADVGSLQISGKTSPGMFVSFNEGGTVIGTANADANGFFSQIFPGINPVNHIIAITGSDIDNRTVPPTIIEVFTKSHQITKVSDIILPPSIELDKTQISKGDPIHIFGRSVPNYKVKIMTEPPVNSFEVFADDDGNYSYDFTDTIDLEYGDHKVYSLCQDQLGTQSLFSLTQFFRVVNSVTPPGGETTCDITRGDLNCDSTVDLTDFSILLYYWGMNDATADINGDGNVNLVDFSIMMFYWQG